VNGPAEPQPDLFEAGTTTATRTKPEPAATAEVAEPVAASRATGKPDRKEELRRILGELEKLRAVMLAGQKA
jgi:hypothetical protein